MNRAMRRLASRQRKPIPPPKVIPLPPVIDEWAVFNNIHSILKRLESGEINSIAGKPVFQDERGHWCEICPALSGWISCWERIDREFNLQLLQDPLARLHNKLNYSMPLNYDDIYDAQVVVQQQREWFRKLPRQRLTELAKTEQIALYMEDRKQ